MKAKKVPDTGMVMKELPAVSNAENTVMIGGAPIEIKPTKLKYVRNGTANFYKALENVSLNDIFQWPVGVFGEGDNRDGDKAVMDWLIAATDNEKLIVENYEEMDVGQVNRILEIFKRVNKFVERDNSKNAETPRAEE